MTSVTIQFGRAAMGGLFTIAGLLHIIRWRDVSQLLAHNGIIFPGGILLLGTAFQIIAGVFLMFGLFVRPAAFGLIAFTVAATLMMLRFWTMPVGPQRSAITNAFLSNVGIVGGLLLAASTPA